MNLPRLTVIEASAGTGKTFSLVTRLLTLIFNGVSPERIVALTFSRFAAGEIFNSFIERLAKAASDDRIAAEEAERLALPLTRDDFSKKLRLVIARQHLSQIGTLDSFLMRIVRLIPYELGLEGEVSVMSDYRSPYERLRLVGEILNLASDDAKALFRDAFLLAFGSFGAKGHAARFSGLIERWHGEYMNLPERFAWGERAAIWGEAIPKDLDVTIPEIRSLAKDITPPNEQKNVAEFIRNVERFAGSVPADLPKPLADHPIALKALKLMRYWKIARKLDETAGIYRLMHIYESGYKAKVRDRGLVTFDDLPRLLKKLAPSVRLALEYRMDAAFDHWALDEFQDTSRNQWTAISNLIEEKRQSSEQASVFVVGDRKQSIYEWRGGDVSILGELVEKAKAKDNRLEPLDESRRYVEEIAKAVNLVFNESTIRGIFDMDRSRASAQWHCRVHESHDKLTSGFVQVVQATKRGRNAAIEDFFDPIADALMAVKPWERNISTAILVRRNEDGEAIVSELKRRGIVNVVFEGDSNIADSPMIAAMTALIKLSEHPADTYSYALIKSSPLAEALYPDGLPPAADLAAELLKDFTSLGLVRKFREVREALKRIPDSWNAFLESRFEDFLKCIIEFEDNREPTMRLSDFETYVDKKTRRDYAEPGMVRVLTSHKSKGLGFDWVIFPCFESDGMVPAKPVYVGPLEGDEPAWILENPGAAISAAEPGLAPFERKRRDAQRYGSLCLAYVAMTRAKRALTLILNPLNASKPKGKKDAPQPVEKFSDLVRHVGLSTSGDPEWYLSDFSSRGTCDDKLPSEPSFTRSPRVEIEKRRPSESYLSGLSADRLFADDFGLAARRGTEKHAELAKIEWGEGVFAKPSEDAVVWRERSYELFADGVWESGQFDRVVFTGSGENRRATIYDFKTGLPDHADRYAPQMAAYRRALSRLTGIPEERISTQLVFV